jgi:hypothetical protein
MTPNIKGIAAVHPSYFWPPVIGEIVVWTAVVAPLNLAYADVLDGDGRFLGMAESDFKHFYFSFQLIQL